MTKKTGFDAYDVAIELAHEMRTLVEKIRRFDKDLADQTRSACQSIGLNLAEGRRRTGGDRNHLFKVSLGSTGETQAALHQAEAWGYLREEETAKALELLDREKAMLWKLAHR
jgi:four helix bundle protein